MSVVCALPISLSLSSRFELDDLSQFPVHEYIRMPLAAVSLLGARDADDTRFEL